MRAEAEGLAASEEELVLLALFGEEAEALLRSIRARNTRDESLGRDARADAASSGSASSSGSSRRAASREVEIEDEGMRVSVRRTRRAAGGARRRAARARRSRASCRSSRPRRTASIRVESPMVGVFYRSPEPGRPPFVEVGDAVGPGQTLCLLEAMKLFNELKADAAGPA